MSRANVVNDRVKLQYLVNLCVLIEQNFWSRKLLLPKLLDQELMVFKNKQVKISYPSSPELTKPGLSNLT